MSEEAGYYGPMDAEVALRYKYAALLPHLDERAQRLVAAADAREIGHGGIEAVARASCLHRETIRRGLSELDGDVLPVNCVRQKGGGRHRLEERDRDILVVLEALVDPHTRGDPTSHLRWTSKSTAKLAAELTATAHPVSARTVARLLRKLDYSLQGTAKTREGGHHPDRDAQFRHINDAVCQFFAEGQPVISVDGKKKELIGPYAQKGQEWQPCTFPEEVNVYDFPDDADGKAIPYGVYDLEANQGWVSVGCTHDTASFAVATIRQWWEHMGKARYPHAQRLLVCADGGGSNGSRVKLWKYEVQRWADEVGLDVWICHFPPGTSKWNKIEHRLFSQISLNWRGRPLTSFEVVVNLISATTNSKGLAVRAALDKEDYPVGVEVTADQLASIQLEPDDFHPEWNYKIKAHSRTTS